MVSEVMSYLNSLMVVILSKLSDGNVEQQHAVLVMVSNSIGSHEELKKW